jgi:predicted ChrR family anti-sigma factor
MGQNEIRASLSAAYARDELEGAMRLLVEAQSAIAPPGARIVPLRAWGAHAPGPEIRAGDPTAELSTLPAVVQDAAIRSLATRKWRAPIPGLKLLDLEEDTKGVAFLLRAAPRAFLPEHGHAGTEYALVLAGKFADGIGEYEVGEISVVDQTIVHRPRALQGPCWILIVRHGAIELTGALGVLQRMFSRAAR